MKNSVTVISFFGDILRIIKELSRAQLVWLLMAILSRAAVIFSQLLLAFAVVKIFVLLHTHKIREYFISIVDITPTHEAIICSAFVMFAAALVIAFDLTSAKLTGLLLGLRTGELEQRSQRLKLVNVLEVLTQMLIIAGLSLTLMVLDIYAFIAAVIIYFAAAFGLSSIASGTPDISWIRSRLRKSPGKAVIAASHLCLATFFMFLAFYYVNTDRNSLLKPIVILVLFRQISSAIIRIAAKVIKNKSSDVLLGNE